MSTTTQTADAAGERRRQRDQRGIRSTQSMKSERLPSPPRQRRPALAALAVLLIVGGAAVAALLAMRVDSRVPVLQANQTIYAGQQLTPDMFTTTQVAAEGTPLVPESDESLVYGNYASSTITESQLLDATMLSASGFLGDGEVALGVSLPAGYYPSEGLNPGDIVDLIRITDNDQGTLVRDISVSAVGGVGSGEESATAPSGDATLQITLIVDTGDASSVAAASARGQLAAALVEPGAGVGDSTAEEGDGADDGDGGTENGGDGSDASDEG